MDLMVSRCIRDVSWLHDSSRLLAGAGRVETGDLGWILETRYCFRFSISTTRS
jgi:hypothetical protein